MSTNIKSKTLNNNVKHRKILTNREIEFLCLVALGYGNNLIAENLFVTKSTVKKTLENIFKKLNAKDRANAVAVAFIHNIISVEILNELKQKYDLMAKEKI